jgi:hypothetical protein
VSYRIPGLEKNVKLQNASFCTIWRYIIRILALTNK